MRMGSVQSDWDGNIFYFGAEHYGGAKNNHDKVIKYSPTTNSSSVVAQLPHNILGIPTINVLILGIHDYQGLAILSFDLARGSTTPLSVQLPARLMCAIKFRQYKSYLFTRYSQSRSMWEMDLVGMTFKRIPNIYLPNVGVFYSVVTDQTFVLNGVGNNHLLIS